MTLFNNPKYFRKFIEYLRVDAGRWVLALFCKRRKVNYHVPGVYEFQIVGNIK